MNDQGEATRIARAWWKTLAGTSYVPLSAHAAESLLADLVNDLVIALDAEPFDAAPGFRAGTELVRARFTNPVVVASSTEILSELTGVVSKHDADFYCRRLSALLGALGQGFATELQRWILAEQESVREAVLTARRQAEEALRASEARFRAVFNSAAVAIAIGDTHGRLIDANPALAGMLGKSVADLRGAAVFDFFHPDDQMDIKRRVYEQLVGSGGGTVRLEERFLRSDGSHGWTLMAVTLLSGAGEQDDCLIAIGEDVTERRHMQAELYRQARHDPLTGLPNRLLLREKLEAAITAAGPDDHVGLCFLDLDGFKEVNDRHGHGVGDRLLAAVAARLRDAAASGRYLVARIGGDEFVAMISPPADTPRAVAAAQAMLAALTEPAIVDGHSLAVSASIGVVVPPLAGTEPEALLDAADKGLYLAKAGGRGQWVLHTGHGGECDAAAYDERHAAS